MINLDTSLNKQPQKTKQIKYYSPNNPSNKWQPLSQIAGKVEVCMNECFIGFLALCSCIACT